MKCISFSLFGTAPIYLQGALRNAEMAKEFYPDWTPLFWVERESVPAEIITGLLERGARVRPYSRMEFPNGMFARFCVADMPDVERFVIRDCDSRPSHREANAVTAWIESSLSFHAMRDHPFHAVPMLGAMWGSIGGILKNVNQSIQSFHRAKHPYTRATQYGADQEWLWANVWPHVQRSGLVHDSCLRDKLPLGIPFPESDDPPERFVGEIFDENDQPNAEHRRIRNTFLGF